MSNDYDILPVKTLKTVPKEFKDIADIGILPVHPFYMCIYASPKSGKSNLIVNMLKNKNFKYQKRFDTVYYISPTLDIDKTLKSVVEDEEIIKIHEPEDINEIENIISLLLEQQKSLNQDGEEHKALFILDDMLGKIHDSTVLTQICSKYRHYNCSFIVVSQAFKSISPIIRQCASNWVLFHTENTKEFMKVCDEFLGIPNFKSLYNDNTAEKYSFLYIDVNKQAVYKNFKTLLYQK
jgi:hypothetical protein